MALNLTTDNSSVTSTGSMVGRKQQLKLVDDDTFCANDELAEEVDKKTSSNELRRNRRNPLKRMYNFCKKLRRRSSSKSDRIQAMLASSRFSEDQTRKNFRLLFAPLHEGMEGKVDQADASAKAASAAKLDISSDIKSPTPYSPPCQGSGIKAAHQSFEAADEFVEVEDPVVEEPAKEPEEPKKPAPVVQPRGSPVEKDKSILEVDGKRYKLRGIMGQGTYGMVQSAWDVDTGRKVAIKYFKIENADAHKEIEVYKNASKSMGANYLPEFLHVTKHEGKLVMITAREGHNLGNLATRIPHRRFFSQTIAMLAIELLNAFEAFHNAGYVHRDVHMGNVLAGHRDERKIFLCDLGFAQPWRKADGTHIKKKELQIAVGTSRFSSINNHKHTLYSRRDDLESMAYLLINCLAGDVPWSCCAKIADRRKKWDTTMKMKLEFEESEFFKSLPPEMQSFLTYAKQLKFDETPDYQKCRDMFEAMKHREEKKHGVRVFDWMYVWDN